MAAIKKMVGIILSKNYIIFLILFFAVVACDNINFFSRPYVATVNGAKIYLDEYQVKLSQKTSMLPKDSLANQPNFRKRLEEEVLDSMVTDKIMYLRAQELDISISSDELEKKITEIKQDYGKGFYQLLAQENLRYEQWKEDLKKEMLLQKLIAADVNAHVRVSEDEAEDYFNEHRDMYKAESRVHVLQIVVRDFAKAQKIMKQLTDGSDFAKVAAEESIGPEARNGGDLGFITKQVMPEPLDETIFKLSVGRVSSIVQSPYGFHIFKVLEIQPAKTRSFVESKEEVMSAIRARKEDAAFTGWLEALKMKAVIKKESTVLRNQFK
jgi:parvulin-like peptidyl-prolyl isomerase